MKDYRLKEEINNIDYILEYGYEDDNKDSLYVKFSNRDKKLSCFKGVKASCENIRKLDNKMERQMNNAIADKKNFIINKEKSFRNSLCQISFGVAGIAVEIVNYTTHSGYDKVGIPIAIAGGVLTIAGMVEYFKKYRKTKEKVDEIEKAEYMFTNKSKLDSISSYPNTLVDTRKSVLDVINHQQEAFKVNNLDLFTKQDLEEIIKNFDREELFKFEYQNDEAKVLAK